MFKLHFTGNENFKWISFVQNTFNDLGLCYVFELKMQIFISFLKPVIRQPLCDKFVRKFVPELNVSSRESYKSV